MWSVGRKPSNSWAQPLLRCCRCFCCCRCFWLVVLDCVAGCSSRRCMWSGLDKLFLVVFLGGGGRTAQKFMKNSVASWFVYFYSIPLCGCNRNDEGPVQTQTCCSIFQRGVWLACFYIPLLPCAPLLKFDCTKAKTKLCIEDLAVNRARVSMTNVQLSNIKPILAGAFLFVPAMTGEHVGHMPDFRKTCKKNKKRTLSSNFE